MLRIANLRLTLRLAALAAAVAACSKDTSIGPLPITATVSLQAGEYVVLTDTAAAGAVAFPAAGAAGAEYLVVGQLGTPIPDLTANARLGGQAAVQAGSPLTALLRAPANAAERFHVALREREAVLARAAWQFRSPVRAVPPVRTPPPALGTKRTFKVCADLDCGSLKNVAATVQWTGVHAAIFVDDSVASTNFGPGDLDQLGTQFDTVLYPLDRAAFGTESDIDGNAAVLVLLTRQVNALIGQPDCQTAFITGFFFGADIAPGVAPQYNNGELFYGMAPDPAGTVSCPRTIAEVKAILPITFAHEFQHMISFNEHVLLRPGLSETLWLNEALSHMAEELAGLHYDSLGQSAQAGRFHGGNLYNAYSWLQNPAREPLVTEEPPGSLESRGAFWLFVRWLVDRHVPLTRQLVQTSEVGAANVEAAAGVPFAQLLGRWALAQWVNDLPAFTPPPALTYDFWRFRSTFDSLNNGDPVNFPVGFPLAPANGTGGDAVISGTVASGSGHYLRITQPASGASFELTFRPVSGGVLPLNRGGQLAIVRIR